MFKKQLDQGEAGDNVGILIKGYEREDIWRGIIACKPGTLEVHSKIEANIYCLKSEEGGRIKPFVTGYKPQMYFKTSDTAIQIALPETTKMAMPGDNLTVKGVMNYPMALAVGDRFALREGGKTVAIGIITKLFPKEEVI